ncbi:MAG: translation initiation factor IF-2 [Phycisphaeraceae bacterium]|nr:MAG: translation initiation factor IF-2 [Phycisphaeraceae bacterium]
MASKRISQLAKELGVESKTIVAKCRAEGIPESLVKGHMSTVSAGLEATIREWFSGEGTATAVETAEKIEAARIAEGESASKAPSRSRKAAAGKATPSESDSGSTTAVVDAPKVSKTIERSISAEPATTPAAPVEARHEPVRAAPKPVVVTPAATSAPDEPAVRATSIPVTPTVVPAPAATTAAPPASGPPGGGAPAVVPAPANVPRKPTTVVRAGPKLEIKTPVKLSGPKIVRIEAPEQIEAPRPRRVGPGGPGVGTGGARPAARGPGGAEDDDHGRSPRRKAAPGGAPGPKRSTGTGVPDRRRASSGPEWTGGVFSEQDLLEREARLARSGGFVRKQRQAFKTRDGAGLVPGQPSTGKIRIAAPFTIKDLSEETGVKAAEIVKKLFMQGVMATINSGIEPAKAIEIMMDFDIELEVTESRTAEETIADDLVKREVVDERTRGPVVTILGHVDHGKTSLLDKIRDANVAAGEAGGITQRTSAFRVPVTVGGETKEVVFLDTPGHEAFTSMRSRGASMTDVVVLVVSAPEGVMPQTIESINHAKAAGVPIVVALNKIDRPDATEGQVQKTLRQLADAGLQPSEWGGDIDVVKTSAVTGQGIKELLELLDLQAQVKGLKADFGGSARGVVIEARTEEGRGSVASLLVQHGKLKVGDFIVAGRAFGRVRDIHDDRGSKIREALPPSPVQVSGIDMVPDAGDKFYIVDSLRKAEEAAEQRRHREREAELAKPKLTLDSLFTQMQEGEVAVKEIKVVLKAAEQGTVDVLAKECEKIGTAEVKVRVLHTGIGGINRSDVLLADASRAIIIGFNVIALSEARTLAEQKGVEIRTYDVIYNITDDLKAAAEGLLSPELRQEILGHAEVRQVFTVSKVGTIAGCYVTDGVVERNAFIRVTRGGVVVQNERVLEQLKRFKDDAREVRAGMECGMKVAGYDDIKAGDVIECYKQVEFKRTLDGGVKPVEKPGVKGDRKK